MTCSPGAVTVIAAVPGSPDNRLPDIPTRTFGAVDSDWEAVEPCAWFSMT